MTRREWIWVWLGYGLAFALIVAGVVIRAYATTLSERERVAQRVAGCAHLAALRTSHSDSIYYVERCELP